MKLFFISILTFAVLLCTAQNSFQVGAYQLSLKNNFQFSALKKSSDDTLWIEICSDNLFSPFGVFGDTLQFKNSQLKNYKMKNRVGKGEEVNVIQTMLTKDTSNITFYFFHSSESAPHSYVIQGIVSDKELNLFKTIKIGSSPDDFYKTFFTSFPAQLQSTYHFVILETCVFGIQEIFRFRSNSLYSLRFRCPNCVGVKRIDKY